jgi:hypothetical protein
MTAMGSAYFGGDQAKAFVTELRAAKPTTVGDAVSAALRAVAQAEQPVTEEQGSRALVALALLLSPFEPDVLDDAPDGADLRSWFGDLEIELNPARRQIAGAAIDRLLLPADNGWYDGFAERDRTEALVNVHRLRDLLADAVADE